MSDRIFKIGSAFFLFISLVFALSIFASPDLSKVTGDWEIELDAEGESYFLTMTLKAVNETLSGTISEATGFFSDVELEKIKYDGTRLGFSFTAPTPPDGMDRVVEGDFAVEDKKLEGYINVDDLGISAPAVGTKK